VVHVWLPRLASRMTIEAAQLRPSTVKGSIRAATTTSARARRVRRDGLAIDAAREREAHDLPDVRCYSCHEPLLVLIQKRQVIGRAVQRCQVVRLPAAMRVSR
jgi:hypothetical protein